MSSAAARLLLLPAALVALLAAPAAHAEAPASFATELGLLRRFVACDARAEVAPAKGFGPKIADASCKEVKRRIGVFRKKWLDVALPILRDVVPDKLPANVVYPFGGADLLHALAAYPNAARITTMSLEWVGDPRAITSMESGALKKNLAQQHAFLIKLFQVNHSRTADLQSLNASPIPAPLVFALTALELLGYEPLEARWFQLDDAGRVVYLTPSAIAAFDKSPEGRKQKDRNVFFANVEVRFRKSGVANAPEQVWRHMRANLHDEQLRDSPVARYIKGEGPFAGLMKAASYLIWSPDFSVIRDLMLDNMVWMISDTSGIGPSHAAAKGFKQQVWGDFKGSMFGGAKSVEREMIELWKSAPHRKLPVQFGYPDKVENNHLMVTYK
jgi:hypothetical protein